MNRTRASLAAVAALSLVTIGLASATPAQAATRETRTVCKAAAVNVRAKASSRAKVVGAAKAGTALTGTKSGSWFVLDGGRVVAYRYTCPSGPVTLATTAVRSAPPTATAPPAPPAPAPAPAPVSSTLMMQPVGTNGSPTSPFGNRLHPITKRWTFHSGVDIGSIAGANVIAAAPGVVTKVGRDSSAGINVTISHGTVGSYSNVTTRYLHLRDTVVSVGQTVSAGQLIAHVGSTGAVTKPHLHFSVYVGGTAVDPQGFIGPIASLHG